jgi:hypothetical protein
VTLFATIGDPELRHESEPSFRLASLELSNGRRAQLVAHTDPENDIANLIASSRARALEQMTTPGIDVPEEGYLYFFGKQPDGARFIVGARARPS